MATTNAGSAWRSAAAFIAGFVAMGVISPAITALLRAVWPVAREPQPPDWFLALDLAYALGAMVAGGYVCAWIARRRGAPVALAAVVLMLGLATIVGGFDAAHPAWYLWLSALLGPLAVLAGASIRVATHRTHGS